MSKSQARRGPPHRRRRCPAPPTFALGLALCVLPRPAAPAAEETNPPAPDKSRFGLFHPTPDGLLRELSADRPDKTDSAFTVDAGRFQVEMDFANLTYDRRRADSASVTTLAGEVAPMLLKVGLLNNVDFQLALVPFAWERAEDRGTGAVERASGFGDTTPRLKINLVGNDGGFFALALMPFLKIPTHDGAFGRRDLEGGLKIPYAFDVPGWDLSLQSEVDLNRDGDGTGHHADFLNSVSVGRPVLGRLSLYLEFFSSVGTEEGSDWIGTVDTWLTYQLTENLRLDAGVYIGVTPAADDWHPFVGTTWRF